MATLTAPPTVIEDGAGTPTYTAATYPAAIAEGAGTPIRSTASRMAEIDDADPFMSSTDTHHRAGADNVAIEDVTGFDPVAEGTPTREPTSKPAMTDSQYRPIGVYIPGAYFRTIRGVVVDEKGEPITDAEWLVGRYGLPTAGRVDDEGRFEINLLRADYSNFALLVDSGKSGVDYVWYEAVSQTITTDNTDEVTLVFKESRPTNGLSVLRGVSMG
ncbi:hypothetical protein [Natrinema versiforme]|uniref:Uncharacterized protein n=1 Tax=Natrinema versiforme JCM 10478 TaxID=1227496 RepID=L9Y228_9EURY|nr:hypothetical protein [Natrinema versiforme]ELY68139.1 hypothetical protein C489_09055 [Natrinema versiforme JCM 10478]